MYSIIYTSAGSSPCVSTPVCLIPCLLSIEPAFSSASESRCLGGWPADWISVRAPLDYLTNTCNCDSVCLLGQGNLLLHSCPFPLRVLSLLTFFSFHMSLFPLSTNVFLRLLIYCLLHTCLLVYLRVTCQLPARFLTLRLIFKGYLQLAYLT